MTTLDFLDRLRRQDVEVWVEGDQLAFSAPEGMMTPDLRTELAERKTELINLLRKPEDSMLSLLPAPREQDLPLSFAQQRLWFLDQYETDLAAYNMPTAVRVSGPLDVEALEKSLAEIIRRHETLRTTFSTENGQPHQIIESNPKFSLPIIDLQHQPADKREAEARGLAEQDAQQPFDLTQGVIRISLIKLDADDHVLIINTHHIATDGWSQAIFYRELGVLYEAFSVGEPSPLPDLPIQYADFALWQRGWLQGEVLDTQLDYWVKQLENAPVLELPTDHPRPPFYTYQGGHHSIKISTELTKALKRISRQENVSLFMTLLAGYVVLLHRYSGQDDVLVGSFIANRNRTEIENLIGFFVNTLALHIDLSGSPTFREVLQRVRSVTLGAYANQDLPFEKLVEEIQPERDLSRHSFFQTTFLLQNLPAVPFELTGLDVDRIEIHRGVSQFDLSFILQETQEESLTLTIIYNTNLFDISTIDRLADHYQTLLGNIVSDPDQAISMIAIIPEKEYRRMIRDWNASQALYPEGLCIHQLFEEWAERTPDEIAVVFKEQRITYGDLNSHANQIAKHLKGFRAQPETKVAIFMDRSLEMIIAILGVLKIGAAYVPLDTSFPKERLSFMIEDSDALVVLAHQELLGQLPELQIPVTTFGDVISSNLPESVEDLETGVLPENLAYIMYTSGSTGQPKGVLISHKNVVGFLYGYKQVTLDGPRRIGTTVAPFSFDTSIEEIFSTICFGGTLHIILPEDSSDVEYFANYLVEHAITTSYIVPDFLPGVAKHLEKARNDLKLECLITGLAPKKERMLQSFRDLSPDLRILNAYGPTEVTYGATAYAFKNAKDLDRDVPIGEPFPNYEVYIVDRLLQPVPVGVVGELLVGGVGISRGYYHRPGITAEMFIPDPFSDRFGSRLYRTGDLVRYHPDGNIEFLGRADDQVKVRGYRIELGEIETVLLRYHAVKRCVVLAREDEPGDKRLVAYVVPEDGEALTINVLREYLGAKLPGYMVPNLFVFLDELPLMSNGKVDRQALPLPEQIRPELEEEFVAPRNPTEKIIVEIWKDVLGLEQVGVYDNFFEVGGHSLLATQILSRVRNLFQVELPLRILFETPTIAALAGPVEMSRWAAERSSLPTEKVDPPVEEWEL